MKGDGQAREECGTQDSRLESQIDIKQWTRIILILAATLYVLQGGDPSGLPILTP